MRYFLVVGLCLMLLAAGCSDKISPKKYSQVLKESQAEFRAAAIKLGPLVDEYATLVAQGVAADSIQMLEFQGKVLDSPYGSSLFLVTGHLRTVGNCRKVIREMKGQ